MDVTGGLRSWLARGQGRRQSATAPAGPTAVPSHAVRGRSGAELVPPPIDTGSAGLVGPANGVVVAADATAAQLVLPDGVFRQPDGTTCGSASAVMAHYLFDPTAPHDTFVDEVRRTHQRTNGLRDHRGRWQLPWPGALGTQPWALARELGRDGVTYRVRFDDPARRDRDFAEVVAVVRGRRPAALFIGDRRSPRHVVLAFAASDDGATLRIYDPSSGNEVDVDRAAYGAARLHVAGWDEPWLAVVPA